MKHARVGQGVCVCVCVCECVFLIDLFMALGGERVEQPPVASGNRSVFREARENISKSLVSKTA